MTSILCSTDSNLDESAPPCSATQSLRTSRSGEACLPRVAADAASMKILVFAHTPPPHHGQSAMVELLLRQLRLAPADEGRSYAFEVFHVNARVSDDVANIGRYEVRKVGRLLRHCIAAIGHRMRSGVRVLYYVPAPPMRSAVYRDWLVMLLCRPFFPMVVFHWHAAGLGDWLARGARPWERWLTRRLLGRHRLSIVLTEAGRGDAAAFQAIETSVVPNGIPDPCPDYEARLAPARERRSRQLMRLIHEAPDGLKTRVRVLFIGLCTAEKGLFDLLEALAEANARLAGAGRPFRLSLDVAGKFWQAEEQQRFERRCAGADLQLGGLDTGTAAPAVTYHGFVSGGAKARLFENADLFCFPTRYSAESFGLVLLEGMAYGLPVVTTRWRHLPELLPAGYPGLVEPRSPVQLAASLTKMLELEWGGRLRSHFLARYSETVHGRLIREALGRVCRPEPVQGLDRAHAPQPTGHGNAA